MTRATHRRLERAFRTGWRWGCVLGLAAGLFGTAARADGTGADKGRAEPWVSLKLSDLGVPIIPQAFVTAGSSMLTLNVIDETHLLVTFSTRELVPRIPGDPPDDDDRMVAAEVVELPKGKILARTEWHMHDHGRYLWRLGKGRFLVRSRSRLFVITPGALLDTNDPLRPTPFPSRPAIPAAAMISPDASLLTVESLVNPPKKQDVGMTADQSDSPRQKTEILMDFYRVKGGVAEEPTLSVMRAGAVKSPSLLALPMDGDGYLWPGDQKRGKWEVSFNEYGGRAVPVGSVLSSCAPRLQLVSRSEYIAFACQGSEDRIKMEAFGMDGHETWEEPLSSTGMPVFTFAPAAGRFAISRIVTVVADPEALSVVPDGATQEMRVYQTESGDLVLRAPMSPVMKTAENFDLSEDGMLAAVVNEGAVQVYKLRPLSEADQKDLKMAASFSPPLGDGPVNLMKLAKAETESAAEPVESAAAAGPAAAAPVAAPAKAEMKPAVDTGAAAAPVKTDVAATSGTVAAAEGPSAGAGQASGQGVAGASRQAAATPSDPGSGSAGDSDADGPRKPPTLLEPGETAEYRPGQPAKKSK